MSSPHNDPGSHGRQHAAEIANDLQRLRQRAVATIGSALLIALAFFASCDHHSAGVSGPGRAPTQQRDPASAAAEIDRLGEEVVKWSPYRDDVAPYGAKQQTPCTTPGPPRVRVSGSFYIPTSRYPSDRDGVGTRPIPARLSYPRDVPSSMTILMRTVGFQIAEDDRPTGRARITYTRSDGFTAEIDADGGVFEYSFTSGCVGIG